MNALAEEIKMLAQTKRPEDLALGYLRYEALRQATPRQFQEMWDKNLVEGKNFDRQVDAYWEHLTK